MAQIKVKLLHKIIMTMITKEMTTTAFSLFRDWTKKAWETNPAYNFSINNEHQLVIDLEECITTALKALTQENKNSKRATIGYDYGYFIGFICGKLNSHWYHEYITKQTDIYREFNALKAVVFYLRTDIITTIRIQELYKALLAKEYNIDSLISHIPERQYPNLPLETSTTQDTSPIIQALENRQHELLIQILGIEAHNFMPDLELYFTKEGVNEIIHNFENTQSESKL